METCTVCQKVETLLGFFSNGTNVEGPGEVFCPVNTKEFRCWSVVTPWSHLLCIVGFHDDVYTCNGMVVIEAGFSMGKMVEALKHFGMMAALRKTL